jgi:hypothetical protein
MESKMPATVNTPPTMAQVVVRKWYRGLIVSFTTICKENKIWSNAGDENLYPLTHIVHLYR